MKPKKIWSIIEGKHLEKLHLSIDSTGTFLGHLSHARHYTRLKRENKTTLAPPFFGKETGCL